MQPLSSNEFDTLMKALVPDGTGSTFAIAVSGGADSITLCLLMQEWAKQHHHSITALTVDHQLRAESSDEALQVAQWMKALGITHEILTWEHDKNMRGNIPALGRDARYRLMGDWCQTHNVPHLLVAHHLDDQAETFLLRLARGSGVDGLSAMSPIAEREGIKLLRPLLAIPKEQLIATLKSRKQPWIEDPTNQDLSYDRNHLRSIMPALAAHGITPSRLAETASHMARVRHYLETVTAEAMSRCVRLYREGFATLHVPCLTRLDDEIALRLLSDLLTALGTDTYPPRFEALQRLLSHLKKPDAGDTPLAGCLFSPNRRKDGDGWWYVAREPAALAPQEQLITGQEIRWDSRFSVAFKGMHPPATSPFFIGALGEEGVAQLRNTWKNQLDWPLPKNIIYTFPALWHLESVLSVPHMGYHHAACNNLGFALQFALRRALAGAPFYSMNLNPAGV